MITIKVTKLERKVLQTLASLMYAEWTFSDVGFPEVLEEINKNDQMDEKTLKGVAGSLEKKGLIEVDRRESEGYKNKSDMWIWYLMGGTDGLVEHWIEEGAEPCELITD